MIIINTKTNNYVNLLQTQIRNIKWIQSSRHGKSLIHPAWILAQNNHEYLSVFSIEHCCIWHNCKNDMFEYWIIILQLSNASIWYVVRTIILAAVEKWTRVSLYRKEKREYKRIFLVHSISFQSTKLIWSTPHITSKGPIK